MKSGWFLVISWWGVWLCTLQTYEHRRLKKTRREKRRKKERDEEEEEGAKEGWGGTETFKSSSLCLRRFYKPSPDEKMRARRHSVTLMLSHFLEGLKFTGQIYHLKRKEVKRTNTKSWLWSLKPHSILRLTTAEQHKHKKTRWRKFCTLNPEFE